MIYDKSFSFPKAQSYKVSEYKSCSIIRLDNASPMPSYYAHCIKKRALVDMPGSYKMSKNMNIRPQSCSKHGMSIKASQQGFSPCLDNLGTNRSKNYR